MVLRKTQPIVEILTYLYYNGPSEIDRLTWGGSKKRSRSETKARLTKLITQDWVTTTWYGNTWMSRNERFDKVHYKLTDIGHKIADQLPNVVAHRKAKEREYYLDAIGNDYDNGIYH
jgi:hypothetical protein